MPKIERIIPKKDDNRLVGRILVQTPKFKRNGGTGRIILITSSGFDEGREWVEGWKVDFQPGKGYFHPAFRGDFVPDIDSIPREWFNETGANNAIPTAFVYLDSYWKLYTS